MMLLMLLTPLITIRHMLHQPLILTHTIGVAQPRIPIPPRPHRPRRYVIQLGYHLLLPLPLLLLLPLLTTILTPIPIRILTTTVILLPPLPPPLHLLILPQPTTILPYPLLLIHSLPLSHPLMSSLISMFL